MYIASIQKVLYSYFIFVNFWVSLGVRTCELFLCFVAIIRVRAIVLTSFFCFTSLVSFTGSYTEAQPNFFNFPCRGHPLFFFRFLSNAFSDFGSVGRKRKKKTKIKLKRSLELDGLVPQHNIREAWKQQGVVAKSTWRQW